MQKALMSALFEELIPKKLQTEENEQKYERVLKKSIAEFPNEEKVIKTLIELKEDF
jgi:hypothetical protein